MPHAIEPEDSIQKSPYPEMTLKESLIARHSTRAFLPTPVQKSIIQSTLNLARLAPSGSNIQPQRIFLLTGKPLENLKTKLFAVASASTPNIPPIPAEHTRYRSQLGLQIYGEGMGIP